MINKLSDYIASHYISKFWILLIDLLTSLFSSFTVLFVLHTFTSVKFNLKLDLELLVISAAASLLSIVLFRTYTGVMRHSTLKEMWRVGSASIFKGFFSLIVFYALAFSFKNLVLAETSFLVVYVFIDIMCTSFALILVRILIMNLYSILVLRRVGNQKRVLIYGDDIESASLFTAINNIIDKEYKCVGFIASKNRIRNKIQSTLCGFPVYSVDSEIDFKYVLKRLSPEAIIFPDHASAKEEEDYIIDYAVQSKIQVLINPKLSHLEEGKPILAPIREVKIEDLLGRDQVEINMDEVEHFLSGKVVLVTGAAGSIGSQICREVLNMPISKLILLDNAETPLHNMQLELGPQKTYIPKHFIIADVRIVPRLDALFQEHKPDVVFHAAAYKHVPMMESNPCEAITTNVYGTRNIADLAVKYGVEKFVMISTDKAVNPTNVMGASKRLAEIYVQSLSKAVAEKRVEGITKFVTTRFGNVLGSNGSVIPLFREQIKKGGPLTVTHPDIIRYFMTIPEACKLVLEAGTLGNGSEIFVFDMGAPVKIVDLAKNMIKFAGLKLGRDINIEITGLRPGEKLYEELLSDKEKTIPTAHKKIFRARAREYVYEDIIENIDELVKLAAAMHREESVSKMKDIVPEFISSNSKYSRLDKTN